jgi:dihydroorotate dehydrogenase
MNELNPWIEPPRDFWSRVVFPKVVGMDAERVHHFANLGIRACASLGGGPLRWMSGNLHSRSPAGSRLPQVFEMAFLSRVGLSAGFDKNAEILAALPDLGFGFAEIGTVTPRPQGGNPRPRLFRVPERRALFNRMGFNNDGALAVAARVDRARPRLPETFRVGVNIGKNKDTLPESAAADYAQAVEPFEGIVDFVVINVSSPNTPGLRDLQQSDELRRIVETVTLKVSGWLRTPPVLLKLSPDLSDERIHEIIEAGESRWGVGGWVLTNTLPGEWAGGTGGWSGEPVKADSRRTLGIAHRYARKPVISSGGIDSSEEAQARIEMGASLVEIYSSWIYRGPRLPVEIARRLES